MCCGIGVFVLRSGNHGGIITFWGPEPDNFLFYYDLNLEMSNKNLILEPLPKLLLLYLLFYYTKDLEMLRKNLIPKPLPKLLLLYLLFHYNLYLEILNRNLIPEPLPKLLLL